MTISIIISALIPVASVFPSESNIKSIVIAAFGASLTAINAYLSLESPKELSITYRQCRERLLQLLIFYITNVGEFQKHSNQQEKDCCLIEHCEQIMTDEQQNWIELVRT